MSGWMKKRARAKDWPYPAHPAHDWLLSCVSVSSRGALLSLASGVLIKGSTRPTLEPSAAGPTV